MRTITATLIIAAFLSSVTASAATNTTAGQVEFFYNADLSIAQEVRDAVLWKRNEQALAGAFIVISQPSISVTDNGDGTGTISLFLPRPQFDNWATEYGVTNGRCKEGATQQELLDCIDVAIKADLQALTLRYRNSQVSPQQEPDLQ